MPSAIAPTGTLMKKIHGQEKLSVIQPPSTGPTTGATRIVSAKVASATPAFSRGYVERSSVCESGIIGPATAPCTMRKKTSIGMEMARPQRSEARTKSAVVARKSRTCPKRSVSQPVSGTEMAFATAKEVMVQVPWLGETPRSPAIAGMETLAIDVSSTFMNVARPTASDAATRAPPWSGLMSAGCATRRLRARRREGGRGSVLGDDALDALVRLRERRLERLGLVDRRVARQALEPCA